MRKLLIIPVCSNPDVDIDHHNRTKRLVSLGLCFTLSLILIFGSINSLSFTPPNNAFAADMPGDSMGGGDSNQGGDSGDGVDNDDDDNSDGMPKDAPLTTGALTAGGDSDNDDDDDNDSGENQDDGNDNDNDNNDNEPTSKDAPVTSDTLTAKKIECPKGQEVTLFSTSCIPSKELSPVEKVKFHNYDVSSRKNPDGSKTDIFQHKDPAGNDIARIEKTTSKDGNIQETIEKDGNNDIISSTEKTTSTDGTITATKKDKDNNLLQTTTQSKGGFIQIDYSRGKPSQVIRWAGGDIAEKKEIAPDDSFTKTSSYEPGSTQPTKVVTDYREPPRKVTETFDGNVRKVRDHNLEDGWTTTKSTDQRTGSTTAEITKTNPDGSISTKNPDDNTITTRNKDGTWFMTFPESQDGSVKTYHSDGRTTIEKPK